MAAKITKRGAKHKPLPASARQSPKAAPHNPMWGGKLIGSPDAAMAAINVSLRFDRKLYAQDLRGSRAHAEMLVTTGILTAEEGRAIAAGLARIEREIKNGEFVFREDLEDIHMNVEARLAELIGETAGKLHTARSRNDQAALDLRLYVRDAGERLGGALQALQTALLGRAEEHAATIMPGFTHFQIAQPVTFGHYLLAYVEMLGRDRGRLRDALARLDESPLGSAALAGTSFPIDRDQTARALGFSHPAANSLDAVSDRDFALEFLAAAAIGAVHLSRLAEELVLWSSAGLGFIVMPDAFSSGSSIMPQKRNPDAAELVRGKTGRIAGALMALLTTMKALPLAYNKDMQEDKEPVFDAVETWELNLAAMTGMIAQMKVNARRMRAAAEHGYATATDLADWLVRRLNLPFRRAHHVTAQLVAEAESRGIKLSDLTLAELRAAEPRITKGIYEVLGVEESVASRTSFGGTAPAQVRKAVKAAKAKYL